MPIDLEGLRKDLAERSNRRVKLYEWDPYILGDVPNLSYRELSAKELAEFEEKRWRSGRFSGRSGELTLCVADAILSAQKKYEIAARTVLRPFAQLFQQVPLHDFAVMEWPTVFHSLFRREPDHGDTHHLSYEGRIRTTIGVARRFVQAGVQNTTDLKLAFADPARRIQLQRNVTAERGLGPALFAYIGMNAGHLTMKLDTHVRRVLAPYLGLRNSDPAEKFEQALVTIESALGMTPFQADQIIWYTESESGKPLCS